MIVSSCRVLVLDPAASLPAPTRTVLVPGVSAEGPRHLAGPLLGLLIDIERRGLHTMLVAEQPADLHTPVAAICRFVVAADAETCAEARRIWGAHHVRMVSSTSRENVLRAARALPVPAARTVPRRAQAAVQRLRKAVMNRASRFRHPQEGMTGLPDD